MDERVIEIMAQAINRGLPYSEPWEQTGPERRKLCIDGANAAKQALEAAGYRVVFFDAPKVPAFLAPVTLTRGCAVCGIGADSQPMAYHCNRTDCPSAVRATAPKVAS